MRMAYNEKFYATLTERYFTDYFCYKSFQELAFQWRKKCTAEILKFNPKYNHIMAVDQQLPHWSGH
jgi:hypothetical protein